MSPAQADVLQRLIIADRAWRLAVASGEPVHPDDRGIEVDIVLNAVARSTAMALVRAGVAEMLDTGRNSRPWLFLGRYEPDALD